MVLLVRIRSLDYVVLSILLSFLILFTNYFQSYAYASPQAEGDVRIQGELKKWHKITLEITGPASSEQGGVNPFLDYRLDVTFRQGSKQYKVPGYYAADGKAGESSASSGNIWKVHFTPDATGSWDYEVSFRQGSGIAVSGTSGSGLAADGVRGSFTVGASDKKLPDNRARGRLQYVGGHFLQYAESGEYFLKGGADAPENFLAYDDFDGTQNKDGISDELIKSWSAHQQDWRSGDATWQGGKGKGMIGAINYLASKGLNVFSFLTLNILGDDKNVFPYVKYNGTLSSSPVNDRLRFDVSKLDQWEVVFEHAETLGMFLHFKLQETEVDVLLDGGKLGVERKLYYREMIARFGHHLALNWNLGEEHRLWAKTKLNDTQNEYLKQYAAYIHQNDPYHHHLVVHTNTDKKEMIYPYLLGDQSKLTGFSLQSSYGAVHADTKHWLQESVKAGKPWVASNDEQGPADAGLLPDGGGNNHGAIRKNVLWGNLMAGGSGCEFYFGYDHAHSDLTCEDWRSRDDFWDYVKHALKFFGEYVPYWEMQSADELVGNTTGTNAKYCLAKPGEAYVVYLANGGSTQIDLSSGSGTYTVKWYNPREGGALLDGSVKKISGSGGMIGQPPSEGDQDWVALLQRSGDVSLNISKFVLYDTESQSIVADPLQDGAVIQASDKVSVVAVSEPSVVGSVKFSVNGAVEHISNGIPYAIAGHSGGGADAGAFVEEDGIVMWEAESVAPEGDWQLQKQFGGYSGSGYYNWIGNNYFNSPGQGALRYVVKINKAGNYEFVFHTKNTLEINGEHNDAWVKLPTGKNVAGEEPLNGDWTKVFQSQPRKWSWQARTVDHVNRPIRVYLQAGSHEVLISGRSNGHAIDRIALYKYDEVSFSEDKFNALPNAEQVGGQVQLLAWPLQVGAHTITATPFADANAKGSSGNALSININVVDGGNTNPLPPSAPGNLQAVTISSSQIDLTWKDNANDESGFKVERSSDGGETFTTIATVGENVTSYSSQELESGYTYHYRVRAYNSVGNSPLSNVTSATTDTDNGGNTNPLPPSAPGNLQAITVSSSQIDLTWKDNANDESGFKIRRSSDGGKTFTTIATVGENVTSYSSQELESGYTYHYRVRAYNSVGNSPLSNVTSATTDTDIGSGGGSGGGSNDGSAVTLLPEADSWVIGVRPNDNYGGQNILKVRHTPGDNWTNESYLRFDLSNAGGIVQQAELVLYVVEASDAVDHAVSFVSDDSWPEYDINWNNKPAAEASYLDKTTVTGTGSVTFDVTTKVQEQLGERVSFLVHALKNVKPNIKYASKEYENISYRPVLKITYTDEQPPAPAPEPEPVLAVTKFVLYDPATDKIIGDPIQDGAVINLDDLGVDEISIEAVTEPQTVGSVKFLVNGTSFRVENEAPYALAGDIEGDFNPWDFAPGVNTITAIPYSEAETSGEIGEELTITVTLSRDAAPEPAPTPEPEPVLAVTKFVLYDAATDKIIGDPIQDGAVINLDDLGVEDISVVAVTEPQTAGSVKFLVNGTRFSIENEAPYALTGDTEGDFRAWDFAPGVNTIRAVPYSEAKTSGEKGKPLTITVTLKRGASLRVAGTDTKKKDKGTEEQLAVSADNVGSFIEKNEWSVAVYPNPVSDVLHLSAKQSGTYHLFGLQGIMEKSGEVLGGNTAIIDVSSVPAGVYYLRVTTEESTSSQKIIISR